MNKKIFCFFLFFLILAVSSDAKSKNVFSQILNVYETYQEINMTLWLVGDVGAEKRLGEELKLWQGILTKYERDKAKNEYVKKIFDKLLPQYNTRGMKFTLTLIKDGTANAFVIPGGHVFVNTGMLDMVASDDELAAVIAHEMAHAQMRHSLKNFRVSTVMVAALKKAANDKKDREAWGAVLGYLTLMKFSRTQEREADEIGHWKMAAAGFNPLAQVKLWEKFLNKYGDTKGIATYLGSHPPSSERVKNAKDNLAKMNLTYDEKFTNTAPAKTQPKPKTNNLIINPGFEEVKADKNIIANWVVDKGSFKISSNEKHTGIYSLESLPFDRMSIPRIYSDFIAVKENSSLLFTGWFKVAEGEEKVSIGLELYDKEQKLRDRMLIMDSGVATANWKAATMHLKNQKKKKFFKKNYKYMKIFLQTGPGATKSVWFDDIELIPH